MKIIQTEKMEYKGRIFEIRVTKDDQGEKYIVTGHEDGVQKTRAYTVSAETQFDAKVQIGVSFISKLVNLVKDEIQSK